MVCIQYTLFFPPTNKSRSFPFKMAPAFLTTLHPATTSFRFPAGAGGWSRPHWAPLAAPTTLSPAATPAVPRRLLLPVPVAAGIWDLISGGAGGASLAVRRGMQLFRQGDVAGSLAEFDKAIEMDPRQKQCTSSYLLLSFQIFGNGASHYTTYTESYLFKQRFEEGAEQFRIDVAANPNDTEESIWCFLCEAQLYGIEEARKRFLEVGLDSRPVMREAYALFRDGGDPEKLVANFSSGSDGEIFYSSLYTGLYYESQKDGDMAKSRIVAACKSPYGSRSGDYMASLAFVHCQCRNWNLA